MPVFCYALGVSYDNLFRISKEVTVSSYGREFYISEIYTGCNDRISSVYLKKENAIRDLNEIKENFSDIEKQQYPLGKENTTNFKADDVKLFEISISEAEFFDDYYAADFYGG